MIATLETKLISTKTLNMVASLPFLYNILAFSTLATTGRIIKRLKICARPLMKKIKTVVAANLAAFSALEHLFIIFIDFLKQRSFATLLADSYITHPIISIKEDIYFLLDVVSEFMVNAMS